MSGLATISIVSMNPVLARRCVESLERTFLNADLFLTSNGSAETAVVFASTTGVKLGVDTLVVNETNKGFMAPNRLALERCSRQFFITLNDDVVIQDREWLREILARFEDEKVAAVGVEGFPCELSTPGVFKGSPGPRVDYVEMSCAAFRTEALRGVDAFPEWLEFAYGEDVHAGIALARAGYKLTQVPVKVTHEGSATAKTMDLQQYKNRNHAALMRRHGDFWTRQLVGVGL